MTNMTNYIIEGGINFYEELYKSLDVNDEAEATPLLCLITSLPLTENFVTMECKHTFNYIPLFNDICNHKKKFNSMEKKMLKATEIRCPYCRHIQTTLLPYYDNMKVIKVHGVNHFSETAHLLNSCSDSCASNYLHGECCFKYKSGDNKVISCSNTKVTPIGDKFFCMGHKYGGKIALIKEIKMKEKLKEKMDIKEKMLLAKQKLAEEKILQKQLLKQHNIDNKKKNTTALTPGSCQQLLTSGKNKGAQCSCLKLHQDNMCLRHYNLLNKNKPTTTTASQEI